MVAVEQRFPAVDHGLQWVLKGSGRFKLSFLLKEEYLIIKNEKKCLLNEWQHYRICKV